MFLAQIQEQHQQTRKEVIAMVKKYYSVCDSWGNEVYGTYNKEEAQNYFLDNDDEMTNDLQAFEYKEVEEIDGDGFNMGTHLEDKKVMAINY